MPHQQQDGEAKTVLCHMAIQPFDGEDKATNTGCDRSPIQLIAGGDDRGVEPDHQGLEQLSHSHQTGCQAISSSECLCPLAVTNLSEAEAQ